MRGHLHRHVLELLAAAMMSACASAGTGDSDPTDAPAAEDALLADTRPHYDSWRPPIDARVASSCPPDQYATGFDGAGVIQCAPISVAATRAFEDHCALYAGWRDNCDGCTTAPAKWGRTGGVLCVLGAGANDTCTTASLGGASVRLLGINTGGDVDGNDKLYIGWHCVPPNDTPVAGPCPAGSFVSAVSAAGVECVTALGAITEYLRTSCEVYYGWRDSCNACTTAPSKWGRVGTTACTLGAGADNTCTTAVLGQETVRLFGLSTDGDVNDDDKLYLGLRCGGATADGGTFDGSCPAGQLVVGVDTSGMVECASPLPAAEAHVQSSCHLYQGFRDNCSGCTSAPSKWTRASHAACTAGSGTDNTCTQPLLGGITVHMAGLNTDGNVDENDKLYFGTACP